MFDIEIEKITDAEALKEANKFTTGLDSLMSLPVAYHLQHSTVRTQLFKIKMRAIPSKVSAHFVRHSAVGQLHYVKTNRKDRTSQNDIDVNRLTPVNHMMILNAEHLIDISLKRLCNKSEAQTVKVMLRIKEVMKDVDPALSRYMQPMCIYRGGWCYESKGSCGMCRTAPLDIYEKILQKIKEN